MFDLGLETCSGQWCTNLSYVSPAAPEDPFVVPEFPAFIGEMLHAVGSLRFYRFEACNEGSPEVFAGHPLQALRIQRVSTQGSKSPVCARQAVSIGASYFTSPDVAKGGRRVEDLAKVAVTWSPSATW